MVATWSNATVQWVEPCVCCGKSVQAVPDKDCWEVYVECDDCEETEISRFVRFTSDGGLETGEFGGAWSGHCCVHHPEVK